MIKQEISVSKTARYFQSGEISPATKEVWIICHGYAQLAEDFINRFEALYSSDRCIIAPEGLHRFYTEGTGGKVGASWMTKEERLSDIHDYVNYLDQLAEQVLKNTPAETKIIVFGFSQGCATVCRWVSSGKIKPALLVLYAGVFPPDINFNTSVEKLKGFPVLLACGNDDKYLKSEDISRQQEDLTRLGIPHSYLPFEGKHGIYPQVLLKIAEEVAKI